MIRDFGELCFKPARPIKTPPRANRLSSSFKQDKKNMQGKNSRESFIVKKLKVSGKESIVNIVKKVFKKL